MFFKDMVHISTKVMLELENMSREVVKGLNYLHKTLLVNALFLYSHFYKIYDWKIGMAVKYMLYHYITAH